MKNTYSEFAGVVLFVIGIVTVAWCCAGLMIDPSEVRRLNHNATRGDIEELKQLIIERTAK